MLIILGLIASGAALTAIVARGILDSLPPENPPYNYDTPWGQLPPPRNPLLAKIERDTQTLRELGAPPSAPLSAPASAPPFAPPAPLSAIIPPPLKPEELTPLEVEAVRSWVKIGLSKNEAARSLGIAKGNSTRYLSFSQLWDQELAAVKADLESAAIDAINKVLHGGAP